MLVADGLCYNSAFIYPGGIQSRFFPVLDSLCFARDLFLPMLEGTPQLFTFPVLRWPARTFFVVPQMHLHTQKARASVSTLPKPIIVSILHLLPIRLSTWAGMSLPALGIFLLSTTGLKQDKEQTDGWTFEVLPLV